MDISLIFVIVIVFYFCVIFPLQMRRYIMIRRHQRQSTTRPQTRNAPTHARTVIRRNNDTFSREQSDNHIVFSVSYNTSPSCTESQSDEARAAARHLEAEHRQQIIEIQREIEQQAVRRREESSDPNASHLPPRIINSSTVRSTIYTITPGSAGHSEGSSNSINYSYAPPLTPDGNRELQIHFPPRSNSRDDELPSYEQAVTINSTPSSAKANRF